MANPVGLEWRHVTGKMYAMHRVGEPHPRSGLKNSNWAVFGRVERDATGQFVASCTRFEHIKYVADYDEGVLHVEAIWALEQGST